MTERLRIAVIGYGTAGQALAILLTRDGHEVEIFERVPTPGPVGAGFLLQPSGLQVLWQMGLLDEVRAHAAPVHRLYGDTPCERAVMDMGYAGLDARLHGLGMQRGALFSLLDQARAGEGQLHVGTTIVSVDAVQGRLRDSEGRQHGPFDLVVAADGAASTLRGGVEEGIGLDRVYPWGALWCLLPAEDWPHANELRQRYVAARKMIGLLPVGTRPGDGTPRLSFFWSLPRADFERWQADGMAPWLEELHALWPQASARFAHLQEPGQLARAVYRDAVMKRWHQDRLVLAGDAAHAMSPQLGQGVNMALLDALALRDALRTHGGGAFALQAYPGAAPRARGGLPALEPLADAVVPVRARCMGQGARCAARADGSHARWTWPHAARAQRHPARLVRCDGAGSGLHRGTFIGAGEPAGGRGSAACVNRAVTAINEHLTQDMREEGSTPLARRPFSFP